MGTNDGGSAGERADKGFREIHTNLHAKVQAWRGTRVELDHVKSPTPRFVDPIDARKTSEASELADLFQPRLNRRQIRPLADARGSEIRRPATSRVIAGPRERSSLL